MDEKKRCSICGEPYVEKECLPPCTVRFMYKQFYADLCINCGLKLFNYLKEQRFKKSQSLQYVT